MQRYIGLDAHATSCTFAVIGPSGRRLQTSVVETNGRALTNFVKLIPGTKSLVLEEGTQSEWLYETLQPHVAEIVVAPAQRNTGAKSDVMDAFALAEALRIGAIKTRVHKDRGIYGELRELVRAHAKTVRAHVRAQHQVTAMFRSRAIDVEGLRAADEDTWPGWSKKLPSRMRAAATTLFDSMRALEQLRERAEKQMLDEAKKHRMWRTLQSAPGLGPIRTAQLLAIVVSPARFRTSRQFWAYSGLAVVTRSSSDWRKDESGQWQRRREPTTRGLNDNHNHTMKEIFVGAATTVIMKMPSSPLRASYEAMTERGTKPNLAKLTLARKIAAIVLSMWKNEEVYDPNRDRRKT